MKSRHFIPCSAILMAVVLFFQVVGQVPLAAGENKPVAEEVFGSSGISFVPKVSYARLVLTVSRPDGSVFERTFEMGGTPYLDVAGIYGNSSGSSATYKNGSPNWRKNNGDILVTMGSRSRRTASIQRPIAVLR